MNRSTFLRDVLYADAATSALCGLVLSAGDASLSHLLGVPRPLLYYSGLSLFPFAALVTFVATRENLSRAGVWMILALNVLWAIDSVLLLFTGWIAPTTAGYAFIAAQAVAVAVFAEFQYVGLRRMRISEAA